MVHWVKWLLIWRPYVRALSPTMLRTQQERLPQTPDFTGATANIASVLTDALGADDASRDEGETVKIEGLPTDVPNARRAALTIIFFTNGLLTIKLFDRTIFTLDT